MKSEELRLLAERYETVEFLRDDPSQFMHRYSDPVEQERAAFIAAALSYGSRKQFIPKINKLLELVEDPQSRREPVLPDTSETYYRLHTNRMVNKFLETTAYIYNIYGTLREGVRAHNVRTGIGAVEFLTSFFAERGASDLIPKNATSSCKRLCMFLRWMVRDSSPVDLGLWSDIIDKKTLIIPLDTHVIQEASKLGLLADRPPSSMKTALKLTEKLREIFPEDPTKGDFALFGLGVDESVQNIK